MRFTQQIFTAFEKILNYYLHLDPEIDKILAPLNSSVIALNFYQKEKDTGPRCYLHFESSHVYLKTKPPAQCDVSIYASLSDYLRLAIQAQPALNRIYVQGNIEHARKFQVLFQHIHIDWEAQLAQVVGDPASYIAIKLLANLNQWAKANSASFVLNSTEYLQQEIQILPSKIELEDFFTTIDDLRDHTERLNARILQLHRNLKGMTRTISHD